MQPTPFVFALTPFERALLNLAVHGYTNLEVAERLDITEDEVEFEIGSLMQKLGLCDKLELILVCFQGKLGWSPE